MRLCIAVVLTALGAFAQTATPIKHVVVIFDENNSFDHYFGTYPNAANTAGEPAFHALPNTPSVNGLSPALLTMNPNSSQPFRLDRAQNVTCDNDNHYIDEQKAFDHGLMDQFVQYTNATGAGCPSNLVMGYYDGNTVTALWNYAQHFAMSDNFFDTEFGTTVMGHINLLSGQTHQTNTTSINGQIANGSIIGNVDPVDDDCSTGSVVRMSGKNVGDLLSAANVTWGWFYGDWTANTGTGKMTCASSYNPHYQPFQYYSSTANPHHLPPASIDMIGQTDQANHNYSLTDFWNAAVYGNLPAVSFIKFPSNNTGHPSNSDPLSEQQYLVDTINALQRLPQWSSMAILIAYDDSDGWYDHQMPPIVSKSDDSANDALAGATGLCGTPAAGADLDRCGYGERMPFLIISPYARQNFVDHTVNDTTSILRFIEDNWNLGRIGDQSFDALAGSILNSFNFTAAPAPALILDPATGLVVTPLAASARSAGALRK